MKHDQPTTIAILGCDTVLRRALSVLLESSGYDTTLLDSYPTGVVDELLDGTDLLLLVPGVDEGVREAFLGAMGKSTLQRGDMPVIALSTAVVDIPALTVLPVPRRLGLRRGSGVPRAARSPSRLSMIRLRITGATSGSPRYGGSRVDGT